MFIDCCVVFICVILGIFVVCGKLVNDELVFELVVVLVLMVMFDQLGDFENEDIDIGVDELSEDIVCIEVVFVWFVLKLDVLYSMYLVFGFNQVFVIDFIKYFVGYGWYIVNYDVFGV